MALKNHDLELPGSVHVPHDLEYPTLADLEAGTNEINGTTLEARHIGRLARVNADWTYYVLQNYSPIVWIQFSSVALSTDADRDIYINGTTGSDVTGDGSISAPYATFTRAFRELDGKRIAHTIRMFPSAGTYTEFPTYFRLANAGGKVIIDASGEAYPEVIPGPFTLTSATGVGPPDPVNFTSLATDYLVSGQSWTVDQFVGDFINFTSGAYAGYCLPINSNTADTLRSSANWNGAAGGDTFNIVSAPVTIDVDHPIFFLSDTPFDSSDSGNPFMLFCGIQFQADSGTHVYPFSFFNNRIVASFCNFTSDGITVLQLDDSNLNFINIPLTTFTNNSLADWFSYGCTLESSDGVIGGFDKSITLANSVASTFSCRGNVRTDFSATTVSFCLLRTLEISNSGQHSVGFVYADTSTFAIDHFGGTANVASVYADNCSYLISTRGGTHIKVDWMRAGTITAAYAVRLARQAFLSLTGVSAITDVGSLGAIEFPNIIPVVTFPAWPALGTSVNNGNGSWVLVES